MKSYWKSLLFILFAFVSTILSAQETCDNGVDDDGDGLIDCYDGECSDDGACEDFFFGNTVICADDIEVTTFAIREQWGSADETATSHVTPAIGDLDANGIPEVISINNYGTLDLFVLNGATGETIASADIGFTPENAPIIARIDGDEIGDIIVSQNKGDDLAMYNVDITTGTLTQIWRERASVNQSIGLPGVADFDEDGDVEIYYRNEIMDALTGTVIIAGDGNWEQDYVHGTIAVDVLPDAACADCAGLELITGNEVWAINEATGSRTLIEDMDDDIHTDIDPNLNYYPKYYPSWDDQWSTVSAADYNLDGNIDVIITGALGTSTEKYNGETTIFFWDIANQNVITYHDPTNDFVRGPGRVNIGDVDGDGQLNANFVMDQKLYSLDENFNVHWIHPIKEGSSGFTGCSLFDFDGDGAVEVVYRSEESLLIVDGVGNGDNTTTERREIACVSRTQEEYPVIADVDGDGSSEICVSCYTNNSTPFSPYSNTRYSQIRIYESDGEAWMPARGVWNQHGYYNVNINDDLTIPTEVQDHSVVFSTAGTCEYSDGSTIPFDNRPLNTFLNQAPILNEEGCVEFASPDIEFVGILSATDALCPDAEITVEYVIKNKGDIDISGNLPVSYYAGDPTTSDGVLLDTEVAFLVNFEVDEELTITQTFTGIGGDFELFVVINDNGGTPPLSIPLPTAGIPECKTENNISSTLVGFQSFDLSVEKIFDNRKCVDSYVDGLGNTVTVPDNGQARAYYFGPTPGSNETFWIENFEDRSDGDKSDTDDTAWSSDPGTEGPSFYGVTSYNGSKMFNGRRTGTSNDVGIVTWTSEDIDISDHTDVSVTLDIFENGNQEGSGEWRDFVRVTYELRDNSNAVSESGQFVNGFQIDDFTYAQAFLANLNSDGLDSLLIITVEIHNTSSSEYHYIDNISVSGTGPDILGEFTEPDGFNFYWFEASDTDFSDTLSSSSSFAQMPDGDYNVIGYYENTLCYSDTVAIEIQRVTPTVYVWAYEISPLTQCNTPDGSVGAFVYTQTEQGTFPANDTDNLPLDTLLVADGYEFNWRDNDDITNTYFATGNVIQNLLAKEFAVDVIDLQTRCTNTALVEVSTNTEAVNDPTVTITPIATCGGTGELSASVDGNTADYTFEWFDGNGVKPAVDHTGSTYTVSAAGSYTVRATSNSSSCPSDPVTVVMTDNANAPTPVATATAANTSCDAIGNGSAIADGDGAGTTAGYNFTWFRGNNTLPSNEMPGALAGSAFGAGDHELVNLTGGTYTVIVEDAGTLCTDTVTVDVLDNIVEPTYNFITPINSGNALHVLGKSFIRIPQLLASESAITVSFWVELSASNYANNHAFFSAGNNAETVLGLWADETEGISATITTDAGAASAFSNFSPVGWVNVAFTWDEATDLLQLFIDGVKISEVSHPGPHGTGLDNGGVDMYFARDGNLGVNKFVGNVDEFRVYHRAIPEAEILSAVCDPTGAASSPEVYYNFNTETLTGDGDPIFDQSGNGNDGEIHLQAGSTVNFLASDYDCPLADVINNTSCDPGNPNGQIDMTDKVDPIGANYSYSLYTGYTTTGTPTVNTSGIFSGLSDGFYTVVVTDLDTSCDTDPLNLSIASAPDNPIIATTPTDNTYCVDGDGTIFVSSQSGTTEPTSYTYEIFDGASFTTQIGTINIPDGSIGHTFDDLPGGTYRIRVTNDDTGCSNYVDEVVNSSTTTPLLGTPNVVDNTSCGVPNGFITVGIQGGNIANYLFTWYDGDDSSDPVLVNGVLGENFLNGIDGDPSGRPYTVVAVDAVTGCPTAELTIDVYDNPFTPDVIIVEENPDTSCGVGNGTLRAYVTSDPDLPSCTECVTNYTFEWSYNGVGPLATNDNLGNNSDVVFSGTNNNIISGLSADLNNYSVIATHNSLACSASETHILTEDETVPLITLDTDQDNSFCTPANYDGFITVSVDDDGAVTNFAGYTFTWYNGTGASKTLNGSSTNQTLNGINEGSYSVTVQTPGGCISDTVTFSIVDVLPTLGAGESALTGNSVCDPTSNDPGNPDANGAVTLTPTGGTGAGTFAFALETSGGTAIDNAGATPGYTDVAFNNAAVTTTTVAGLPIGNYVMTITDENSGCSIDHPFAIGDATVDPTLDEATINANTTDNTSCVAGNFTGTATVALADITGAGAALTDYSFFWATAADPATQIDDDEVLDDDISGNTGVEDGDYILIVTDLITGCTSATANITINSGQPTLGAGESALTGNSVCDPTSNDPGNPDANGAVTLTPTGGTGAGTFAFALETSGGTAIDNAGATPGYTDVAFNNAAVTTTTVAGLPIGNYVMTITDENSGCSIDHPFAIGDATVDPTLDEVTINANTTDNTSCVAGNFTGTATVALADITGAGAALTDYSFFWATAADPVTQIDDDEVLDDDISGNTGVEDGDYILIVTDLITGCTSATANITINSGQPTLGAGESALTGNSVCDPTSNDPGNPDANGAVTLTPTGGTGAGTFAFALETSGGTAIDNAGATPGYTDVAFNNAAVTTTTVAGLPIGNYVMTITDENSGCSIDHPFAIGDATVDPTLDEVTINANTTDNTSCVAGNFTGTATVALADITGAGVALTDYSFFWATAADPVTQIDDDEVLDDDISGNTGVEDGDYILIVTDLITGCTSATANITINSGQPTLGAGESALTGNSVCDPTSNDPGNPDANGAVTLTPTGGTGAGTFAFALETSGGTAIDNAGATPGYTDVAFNNAAVTTTTVAGLPIGNYVMTITDENSGCSIDHPFAIGDATVDPTLDEVTINANTTDNTSCVAGNFTGTATVALADITGAGAALTDYSFFWATAADPVTQIDDDEVLDDDISGNTGVEDGDYILIVTDLITGCTSATANITINSGQPTLGAGESALTGNSVCDPTSNDPGNPDANGAVTLTPTGGTGAGTFAFALETSGGTAIDNAGATPGYTDVAFNNAAVTTTTVAGLPIGNYVMTITDENSGCSIDHPFAIGDATVDPTLDEVTINANTTDNTSCVAGNFTGTATVALADITGAGAALTDYSFFWATAADPVTQIDDDEVLDDDISGNTGVEDGDYILIVTDLITGCTSATANITINSGQPTLGAGESALTGNSVCDPTSNDPGNPDANGAVTLTPTGGTGAGTFAFALETSGGTAIDNAGATPGYTDVAFNNAAVTTTTVAGLPIGNYVMTITDENSGCSIDHPFAIGDATVDPTLDEVTINANTTDNTSCVAGNFTGTATVALADITGAGAALTDYSFFWATAADPATQIDDDEVLDDDISGNTGVEDGDYILIVTDLITGCTSATANITINSGQPTLGAGESALTGNSVCDPTSNDPGNPDANGAVTLTPTGGTGAGTFAFALETSGGTAIDNAGATPGYTDVAFNNAAVTTTTVAGLPIGNYVMTITDENSGCSIDHPFAIGDATVDPTLDEVTINANTTDNTSCVAGNFTGTATVALADITGAGAALTDYSFFWATAADPVTQIDDDEVLDDDISGNTGVEDGDYILIVTDLITGCTSATANITINSGQPTLGAGESALTGNSVCDPTSNDPGNPDANGAVTLTPTGGTGAGTFAFALETSGGTAIDNAGATPGYTDVAFNNAAVTTTTVAGLPIGNYVMTITDENSGCSIDHPFAIGDATVDPTLDEVTINANTTDNTSCDPANFTGTATVALADITGAGAALTDYSFFWATAADPTTQIDDDEVLDDDISGNTGVEDGDYILIVTDLITGCTSATANITVGVSLPSITPITQVLQDNFSCDVANPIGSATLTVAEGLNTLYSFEWFVGTSTAGTPFDTDDQIDNQLHGTYTVRVTDNATLCTNTAQVIIGEFTPTLTVGASSSVDHSDCYPSNGQVSVTPSLSFNPAGPPTGVSSNFTYQWYFGTSATAGNELLEGIDPGNLSNPTNVTTNTVSGLSAGDYTVVITETQTGCVSAIETVTIADEVSPYKPTISFSADIIPSSCAAEDGRIIATLTALGAGAPSASGGGLNFTYEWYEGAQDYATLETTGSAAALITGDFLVANPSPGNSVIVSDNGDTNVGGTTTLDRLVSGLYTLVMIDQATGCRYFETFDLPFNNQQTTTTLTIENVDECPDNGIAEVGLADDPSNGGYVAGDVDDITQYTVFLYAGSGVPADRFAAYDVNGRFFPYTYDPTTGDILDGNGDPVEDDLGAVITGPVLNPGDVAQFPQLPAGDYIALAREISGAAFKGVGDLSQCWTAASVDEEILDLAYEPILQSNSSTNNTNCDVTAGNGALSLTVIEDPEENNNPPGDQQPNGYRFTWVRDADAFTVLTEDILTETATSNPTNLNPGDYTVTVQRLGSAGNTPNNCEVSTTLTVGHNPEQHEITNATVSPNQDCSPLDGAIVINDADITDNAADYQFTWYTTYIDPGNGGNVLLGDVFVDGLNNGDQGANSVSGLVAGTYYVEAVHVAKTCETPVFEIEVEDQRITPAFNVAQTAQDIVCDDASFTPTGQATVTITNGSANPADYTFFWFEDAGEAQALDGTGVVAAPLFSANNSVVDQLPAGTYFVRITDITTPGAGCPSTLVPVTIEQFNTTISVPSTLGTAFEVADNENCTPNNGAIQVNDITETRPSGTLSVSGATINITDYDFTWLESDGVTPIAAAGFPAVTFLESDSTTATTNGSADASVITGLPTGTYYLSLENNTTGCVTGAADLIEFFIDEQAVTPAFNVAQTAQDIVCDDASFTPTGQATVTITNGSANPADYTFFWFEDAGEAQALDGTGVVAAPLFSANNSVVDQLPAGTYFVRITDITTPGAGCPSTLVPVTIEQFNTTISVPSTLGTAFEVADNENCTPNNGAIQVNDITETRPSGTLSVSGATINITDYDFTWLESDGVTPIAAAGFPAVAFLESDSTTATTNGSADASVITGLPTGTYYLSLENNTTGCVTGAADLIEFFIDEQAVTPAFNVAQTAQDIVCDDASFTPTGQATVTITNGSANPADYTFFWFEDAGEAQALDGTGVVAAPLFSANNSVVDQLPAGTYFVRITDITTPGAGCPSTLVPVTIEQFNTTISVPSTLGTAFEVADNENCTPNNGAIQVNDITETRPSGTLSVSGATINITDYDFTWLESDGVTPIAAAGFPAVAFLESDSTTATTNGSADASVITGLPTGTYYLSLENNTTGCVTGAADLIEFFIDEQAVTPAFNVAQTAQDIVCDDASFTPTGQATVTITNGSANPADYTFFWFEDAGEAQALDGTGVVAAPLFSANNSVVDQLPAGTYFVRITDITTPGAGCPSTLVPVTIEQFNTTISVPSTLGTAFEVADNENCTPNNGAIQVNDITETRPSGTLSVSGATINITDYDFTWLESDGVTPIAAAGFPAVAFLESDSTTATTNGSADASVITGLPTGTYYLSLENNTTGCVTGAADLIEFFIDEQAVTPAFNVAQTAQDIVCDDASFTPTGQATVTITNGSANPADYTFFWFEDAGEAQALDGTGVVAAPLFSANNSVVDQLPAGTYFVRITDITTPGAGCPSTLVPVTIEQFNTTISVPSTLGTAFEVADNENCTPNNGAIQVNDITETRPSGTLSVSGATINITDYDFTWLESDGVTPIAAAGFPAVAFLESDSTTATTNGSADASVITGLPTGTYYLSLENNTTGCVTGAADLIEFFIDEQAVTPAFNVAQTAQDIVCDDASFTPTGQATVTITNGSANPADYTFFWFEDAGEAQALDGTGVVAAPLFSANNSVVDQLPAGTYFVRITDITTPGAGCPSTLVPVTIEQFNTTISVPSTLGTAFEVADNENCTPNNGAIQVNDITETRPSGTLSVSGATINITDYDFTWLESDGVTPIAAAGFPAVAFLESDSTTATTNGSADASVITGLPTGTYYLSLENNTTGCVTGAADLIEFFIDEQAVTPAFNVAQTAQDIVCDDASFTPTGQATVTITNGSANPADYTFFWFEDAGEAQALDGTGVVAAPLFSANNSVVDQLPAGTYFVRITDITTPGAGCPSTLVPVTIEQFNTTISVPSTLGTAFEVADNENCTPNNGAIQVNDITETRPSGTLSVSGATINITDYDFTWLESDGVTPIAAAGFPAVAFLESDSTTATTNGSADASVITGLPTGTYYLSLENNTTGCVTGAADLIEFFIDEQAVTPAFNVAQTAQDIVCDDASFTPTGQATVTITNGSANPADYTFFWFEDAGEAQALDGTGVVAAPLFSANNSVVDQLPAGTYFVRITDITTPGAGCPSTLVPVTIEQFNTTISVPSTLGTAFEVADNENCTPNNGAIQVNDITETRPSGTLSVSGATINITDYDFTWLESDGVTPIAAAGFPAVAFLESDSTTATTNGSADASVITGLPTGTYYLSLENNTTGCVTGAADLIEFFIDEQAVDPIINLVGSITEDTYCDNTGNVGDGSITISITDDGVAGTPTDFTVTWYRGTISGANEIFPADGGSRGSATANAQLTTLSDLATGNYTVVINKDLGDTPGTGNSGCTTTAVFNVGSNDNIPTIDVSAIQANTEVDSLCVGNSGTIIINDADIDGNLDDYLIEVRQGSAAGGHVGLSPYAAGTGSPTITINGLSADNYYIIATSDITGCSAATAVINVKDSVRNPQISLVSVTPNEDCGGGIQIGGLEVIIDNVYDENDHFTVQWFTGSGAIGGNEIGGANSVILSNVAGGPYSVQIENTNTGCVSTKDFTIPTQDEALFITDYTVDNVSYCVDNGSFAVREISFGGVTIDSAQMVIDGVYDLEVYTTPGNILSGTTATDPNQFVIENLGVGSYYALVRKTDSQCESDPIFFDIEENIILPDVIISVVAADSTCSASGTPAGSLSAEADGNDDTNTDYTFEWFTGSGVGSPLGITTSTVTGLGAGTYTVRVTYLPSGCTQLAELDVPSSPADLEILSATVNGATTCTPANGTITVTAVSSGLVTDYDFDYYDTDPTTGGATPVFTGAAGAAYTTADAGIYWIIGTHVALDCTTEPFQVTVNDNTVLPELSLDDFDFQANCDPSNPNGRLLVLADGQPENATFDFEWYYGTGTGNPLTPDDYTGGSNLTGASTNEVSGIAAGFYTVEVTNLTTGCIITETYEMVDDIPNPIAISTSTSANTSCITPNGKAAVSVISPAPGRSINDYDYYWFTGDIATVGINPNPANANYTGTLIEGLADGPYVVLVIDQIDNFCQSNAVEVNVEDGTSRPVFELTTSDVTVCFDEKDGFASVSVADLSTVNIAWYNDSNVLLGTDFFVDNLDAGTYRLLLTHVVTGCTSEQNFDIFNNAVTPSDPFVLVNNGRNNCQFANGSAIANVDGVTNNYLFEWFDPSDMTTPYATGSEVFNLDTTTYLVRATNLATGCESAFTSVDIGYEVIDPTYEVIFNNSVCLRTEDGSTNQFTGTAIISFEEFQLATDYEWRDATGAVVGNDSRLIDAYPGDYTVTFTAENGCSYSASFTIETSLTIYNGVSANGDGKNDFFLVDCIDYFPNNNLQIFNRAGQKVYDIDGYNNTSIRFEGISNVGSGGLQLPAGTYFYVIDLGTGEDPVQGYLELVR